MQIKEFKTSKGNFQFVNESWETSRSWGHKTTLFKNTMNVGSHKITWRNRTWESYQYQSCMQVCIENINSALFEDFIIDFKRENNMKRLKKGQKEELKKDFIEKDEVGLFELYKLI